MAVTHGRYSGEHRVRRARLSLGLEWIAGVAMPRVQPQVDWQNERPKHLVLTRVVALVHQQAGRDGRRGDDHPPEGDRAEPAASKKQIRQATVRAGNQESVEPPR